MAEYHAARRTRGACDIETTDRRGMLLVDDHAIVREGLRRLLDQVADAWMIAEAGNAFAALECLRRSRIDLAIIDLSLPGMSGLDLVGRIGVEFPDVKVLVLSMHAEEQYAVRAFKAGASGYVTKDSAPIELLAAVRKVSGGGTYVTASLGERLVQQLKGAAHAPAHDHLSNREMEVLQRIVAGQRPADIGAALHMSIKTVSTHKTRIMQKLDVPNTAALIRYGIQHELDQATPEGSGRLE